MKWKRTEDGEYEGRQWGEKRLLITPKAEPGKRPTCWELEIVGKVTPGLGSHGLITEETLMLIGVYPTLKQAKEAWAEKQVEIRKLQAELEKK